MKLKPISEINSIPILARGETGFWRDARTGPRAAGYLGYKDNLRQISYSYVMFLPTPPPALG